MKIIKKVSIVLCLALFISLVVLVPMQVEAMKAGDISINSSYKNTTFSYGDSFSIPITVYTRSEDFYSEGSYWQTVDYTVEIYKLNSDGERIDDRSNYYRFSSIGNNIINVNSGSFGSSSFFKPGRYMIVCYNNNYYNGVYDNGCYAVDSYCDYTYFNIVSSTNSVSSSGWKLSNGKWWYQNSNGTFPANCWKSIGGAWYHFDTLGYMQSGWIYDGGVWYYLSSSGAMVTGWLQVGGTWYYFNPSGAMATGWLQVGRTWYYFNPSGAMVTGWLQVGGAWYYFDASGAMVSNAWVDGKYYMTASGAMATNAWVDGGRYYVDGNGVYVPNMRR